MNTQQAYAIKILLIAFLAVLIITTVKAIISGILNGVAQAKQILSGTSFEEIQRKDKEKMEQIKLKERIKYESTLYKLTHPLGYINMILDDKIDNLSKKGNR